jgi:hypothetical protein
MSERHSQSYQAPKGCIRLRAWRQRIERLDGIERRKQLLLELLKRRRRAQLLERAHRGQESKRDREEEQAKSEAIR